jgi:hypothetical protein
MAAALFRKPHFPGTTLGAAAEERELVADQLVTAAGENRRQAGQARPVLLLLLAERHLPQRLFGAMAGRIAILPVAMG